MRAIDPVRRERIRHNYAGGDLSCDELLYLLENLVAPESEAVAESLVELLSAVRHCNLRAHALDMPHEALHYTVFAAARGYHLRQIVNDVCFQVLAGQVDPPFVRGPVRTDGARDDGERLRARH